MDPLTPVFAFGLSLETTLAVIAMVDPTVFHPHHGGHSMFFDVFMFLLLSVFVSILVGGIIAARKYLQLVGVKGDTEILKHKIQREHLNHDLDRATVQHQMQMLALTAGPTTDEPSDDEVVAVNGKDVTQPGKTNAEWRHQWTAGQAEDAEIVS